jgi:hypothetical protein
VPTGKLTLTFDKAVEGLSAADITLNAGSTGTEKGSLTAAGTAGVYELAVSGVSSAGNVTVTVSKTGYTFTPASKTVAVSVLTDPPIDPTKFTVWFNTNFATPAAITPVQVDADAADKKISAPAATLTREGFTFSGWYKDYGVDPATGLWKYDDADKWNFDTDTVTGNMTLYAGWSGGVKRMPRTYIWNNQPSILEGRLIQLQEGKTYKMGARYIMQPNFGPVYLIARYRSGTGYVTETPRVTLLNTAAGFFKTSEEEFTASYTGWHFIGITMFNTATDPTGGGTYVLHEVWLKEKDGGDINLLNNGDFIQKDLEDSSSIYHRVVNNGQDPFYEAGTPGPRTEWDSASWNLNHNQVHYPYSWTNFIDNLSELTGDAISNGDYSSLQFLKPAHP